MIKKILFALFFAAFATISINAQNAPILKIDKSHTSVNFSINHFFSTVTGRFTKFDGTFNFDATNLTGSNATFSIPISSVNTNDTKRDKHLQSADFFNSKTFPTMSFTSTKFEKKTDKEFIVYGKLTIKNVTKDVALPFKITGEMEHPMMKGTIIIGISSSFKINRNDYGVGTGDWAATMVVGDEVNININMELNKMK